MRIRNMVGLWPLIVMSLVLPACGGGSDSSVPASTTTRKKSDCNYYYSKGRSVQNGTRTTRVGGDGGCEDTGTSNPPTNDPGQFVVQLNGCSMVGCDKSYLNCDYDPSLAKCPFDVATQGKAVPGKTCTGGGANSAAIGSVIQGPDVHDSEINNAFYIAIGTSNNRGSVGAYGGFFLTTFGGTTWYQTPGSLPGTNTVVFISLGNNFTISPNSPTGGFITVVKSALATPANSGMAQAVRAGLMKILDGVNSSGPSAFADPCFDGPWDGSSLV